MKCDICGEETYVKTFIPGALTYCSDCYRDAYEFDDPKRGVYTDTPSYSLGEPDPRIGLDV